MGAGRRADLALLAGDPNQAVFGFRGADPALLTSEGPALRLNQFTAAPGDRPGGRGNGICSGRAPPGTLDGADGDEGSLSVRVADSPHAETALVADALRRAHLIDGVPWSQMAVIVRSPSAAGALPRALAVAGVPVSQPTIGGPVAGNPRPAPC